MNFMCSEKLVWQCEVRTSAPRAKSLGGYLTRRYCWYSDTGFMKIPVMIVRNGFLIYTIILFYRVRKSSSHIREWENPHNRI